LEFSAAAFDRGDSTTLIEVRGRLDAESAGTLQKLVLERVRRSAPHVVLDLTAVTFLDTHGVEILVGTRRLADLFEGSLRIICRDARLITLLRAANLHPGLGITPRPGGDDRRSSAGAGLGDRFVDLQHPVDAGRVHRLQDLGPGPCRTQPVGPRPQPVIGRDEDSERVAIDRGDRAKIDHDRAGGCLHQVGQHLPDPRRAPGIEVAGELERGTALDAPDLEGTAPAAPSAAAQGGGGKPNT
jgi:anti-sigma B factor antagonist